MIIENIDQTIIELMFKTYGPRIVWARCFLPWPKRCELCRRWLWLGMVYLGLPFMGFSPPPLITPSWARCQEHGKPE